MKEKTLKTMFSSNSEEWATPQDFFDKLDEEFHFTLDVCASKENAKCKRYFTKEDQGLIQDWDNEVVWMNPPYGRQIGMWMRKAGEQKNGVVVALVPSRTDTRWFHEGVYGKAELRFIKGRLKFGGSPNSAPFPSLVAIFKNNEN